MVFSTIFSNQAEVYSKNDLILSGESAIIVKLYGSCESGKLVLSPRTKDTPGHW